MGQGFVYRPKYTDKTTGERKEQAVWWIGYSVNGEKVRESSGSRKKKDAQAMLNRRLANVSPGDPLPSQIAGVTFDDLRELIVSDYKRNGRKTLGTVKRRMGTLAGFFGGWKAVTIDERAVERYIDQRLDADMANATINRELSALKRALRLAYQRKMIRRLPDISLLKESNTRKGFLTFADLWGLLECLPEELRPLTEAAFFSGWRKGELLSRDWGHIDFQEGWMVLEAGESKNDQARRFPIKETPLGRILRDQRDKAKELGVSTSAESPVFFRYDTGQRINDFYTAWNSARERAGFAGLLFHDLRRSAARRFVAAGISETLAMELGGWRTRSVFSRYNISDEDALRGAGEALSRLGRNLGEADAPRARIKPRRAFNPYRENGDDR